MPPVQTDEIDAVWLEEPERDAAPPTVDTLRRSRRYERVRLDKLIIPPGAQDDEFMRLYLTFMAGVAPVASTRLSRHEIELGFRRRAVGELIIDEVPADDLELMRASIRSGARPAVWVYPKSANVNPRFTCADDSLLYSAYQAEGIEILPCFLLRPAPEFLEHGAIVASALPNAPGQPLAIQSIMVPSRPRVARIVGEDIENGTANLGGALSELQLQLLKVLRRLRMFHKQGTAATHYHHSLASALARAARLVEALRRIGVASLPDAAAVNVRALYELWLSVYLDWLSPELVGPAFKIHATSTRGARKKALSTIAAQHRAAGWSQHDSEKMTASRERLFRLVESPSERATINPGATLHGKIYPRLCRHAHQDFAAGSPFLGTLSRRDSPTRVEMTNGEVTARFLLQVCDISVGGIVSCVRADTGDVA